MEKQKLLLHCCCAPCSTSVVERLLQEENYDIAMFFSNSNILPEDEFEKRKKEMIRLQKEVYPMCGLIIEDYKPTDFWGAIKGKESLGEGSERCDACIGFRLENTAKYAKENGYDIFASTLSVSPHKNAQKINTIGLNLAEKYSINYLESDFKKKNGFLRSIELCKKYNIYRQTYCGCNLK